MPMWTCDIAPCTRPAVRNLGDCVLCKRHLCSDHLQHPFHKCPKWEDADSYEPAAKAAEERELTGLIKKINTDALAARASHLRGGMPCSIPSLHFDRATRSSVMGGMNYHVEVCFDDGIKWIARVRRLNATSPPAVLRDYIVQGEVATLKFLEQTRVPAPKIFDYALDHEGNPVGSEMRTIGPLSSWGEYHKSSLRLILDLVLRGEIYTQRAVDAYLIHRFLLDLVPSVLPLSVQNDHRRYYLKHADDKGDHIMVDEDFNITGIIDWEWAHIAPPSVAFNSPIGLLQVNEFYEGVNNIGSDEITFARLLEEKGRPDLAGCV